MHYLPLAMLNSFDTDLMKGEQTDVRQGIGN